MTTKEIKEKETIASLDLPSIGEAISHDLGAKMVKDYQDANPNATEWCFIGKNIINQILAQPNCVGIRFYNAVNDEGRNTIVEVGVDSEGKDIHNYTIVSTNGELLKEKGIVADFNTLSWNGK